MTSVNKQPNGYSDEMNRSFCFLCWHIAVLQAVVSEIVSGCAAGSLSTSGGDVVLDEINHVEDIGQRFMSQTLTLHRFLFYLSEHNHTTLDSCLNAVLNTRTSAGNTTTAISQVA